MIAFSCGSCFNLPLEIYADMERASCDTSILIEAGNGSAGNLGSSPAALARWDRHRHRYFGWWTRGSWHASEAGLGAWGFELARTTSRHFRLPWQRSRCPRYHRSIDNDSANHTNLRAFIHTLRAHSTTNSDTDPSATQAMTPYTGTAAAIAPDKQHSLPSRLNCATRCTNMRS